VSPTADGGRPSAIALEQRSFRAEAATAKIKFTQRYSFNTLWNGVSVAITPDQLPALTRLSSVKTLYPVELISIPETQMSVTPEMFTALAMTGADIAQSELGYTGNGIKVAVMDTGIDYLHPDLGGGFGPGYKVFTGWDFVGDAFNADPSSPGYNPVPVPDPYPMDTNGHGTHVAGIVGAQGEVMGVAPDALLGAYRVFGTEGSTTADIMLLAMEQVLADKMDVLNMSIGAAFQWPNYPTAQAADRLVNKGVVVVASIGNSGASGLYASGAPGLGEKVIGVASYDNSHVYVPVFTIDADLDVGYITLTYSEEPPTEGTFPIAIPTGNALGNDPYTEDFTGKIALVKRGDASFAIKAQNAKDAGAVGVVIYNNAAGLYNGTLGSDLGLGIPVVGISLADGIAITAKLEADTGNRRDYFDLDRRYGSLPKSHRRPDFELQFLRAVARSDT
jgi:minor extracellular serine protease Vpr